jgi:hypothetical protein
LTLASDGMVEAASEAGELFGFERTRAMSGRTAGKIVVAAKTWGGAERHFRGDGASGVKFRVR